MPIHSTKAIANSLLKRLLSEKQNANSIKLQKLIYFAHGWHLAITGMPLIDERIQAHPYGVVVASIHHSCREFGTDAITSFLTEFDKILTKWIEPAVMRDDLVDDLLDKIVEQYGHLNAIQLANLSHAGGTPWEKTWNHEVRPDNGAVSIEDDLIETSFKYEVNKARPASQVNFLQIKTGDIVLATESLDSAPDELTSRELAEYSSVWPSFGIGDKKWKRVKNYAMLWNPRKQKGIIKLTLADNVEYKIVVTSPVEFNALGDIFRHEKSVYYNLTSGSIASGWIPLSKEN